MDKLPRLENCGELKLGQVTSFLQKKLWPSCIDLLCQHNTFNLGGWQSSLHLNKTEGKKGEKEIFSLLILVLGAPTIWL